MTISAEIIADSISAQGIRLTTFKLRYPRFIHAEELTHRILETQPEVLVYEAIPDGLMYDQNLSRNASSSRAIPVNRMIEDLRRDPAMPIYWGSNKPGMQAGEELTGTELELAKRIWLMAMEDAIFRAEELIRVGLHKQIANRVLEPWAHINVVVTATDYENFFTLRRHKDAQPEIKELADQMWLARANHVPAPLVPGEWHLPFIKPEEILKNRLDRGQIDWDILKRVSVARCARVSYLTHDGRETTIEEDLALHERLLGAQPLHASPAEHQATPDEAIYGSSLPATRDYILKGWKNPELHGNLNGWVQYRKILPGEYVNG